MKEQQIVLALLSAIIATGLIAVPVVEDVDAKCDGVKKNGDLCKPKKDKAVWLGGLIQEAEASKVNPYCDKLSDEQKSETSCFDRLDYYQGGEKDGLYPCNDGSAREDWQDCPDVSGYNYSSSDSDDEKDRNCGGEECTDYEKEDSWTDDEMCYANDDGSLGERVPCA